MHTVTLPTGAYEVPTEIAQYMQATVDSLTILHGAVQVYRRLVGIAKDNPTRENKLAMWEARNQLFELT